MATDRDAIIFNPATVNLRAYKLNRSTYTGTMIAFIVKGDILNSIFGLVSLPIDKVVYLPQQSLDLDPFANHYMHAVKKALEEWRAE